MLGAHVTPLFAQHHSDVAHMTQTQGGALCPKRFTAFPPMLSKSAHMRFVHSRGDLGLCPKRHLLDRSRNLLGLIYLRAVVPPRSVGLHMPLHILHHIA
jgi:hypothetical protein